VCVCVCVCEIQLIMIVDALEELLIRNGPFSITFFIMFTLL
jgi:hypothetical protein